MNPRPWRPSPAGIVVGGLHFALSVAAAAFLVYMLVWRTGQSEFSGIYILMLGLPWNLVFFRAVGQSAWDQLPMGVSVGLMLGAATINSAICYWVGAILPGTGDKHAA